MLFCATLRFGQKLGVDERLWQYQSARFLIIHSVPTPQASKTIFGHNFNTTTSKLKARERKSTPTLLHGYLPLGCRLDCMMITLVAKGMEWGWRKKREEGSHWHLSRLATVLKIALKCPISEDYRIISHYSFICQPRWASINTSNTSQRG